jgi:hypothetical protein
MIWYSIIYSKKYRWLSNQTWFICTFFYKILIFLNLLHENFIWKNNYLIHYTQKIIQPINNNILIKKKFKLPLSVFLIDLGTHVMVIHLYFKTSLKKYQKMSRKQKKIFKWNPLQQNIYLNNMFNWKFNNLNLIEKWNYKKK